MSTASRKTVIIQWESPHSLPVGNPEIASYTHDDITYGLTIRRGLNTDATWMVCYDHPEGDGFETTVPWERRLLLVTEPAAVTKTRRRYSNNFRAQFGVVVTPYHFRKTHPRQKIFTVFPLLGSDYGIDRTAPDTDAESANAEALCMIEPNVADKVDTISAVNSRVSTIPVHLLRNAFVRALVRRLGRDLEVFERHHRPIARKLEAIAPYRFTLRSKTTSTRICGRKSSPMRSLLREARRKMLEDYCPYAQLATILGELSRDDTKRTAPRLEQPAVIRNNKKCKSVSDIIARKSFRLAFRIAMLMRRASVIR